MKKWISMAIAIAIAVLAYLPGAYAKGGGRVAYGGGKHTASHGGNYAGGQGSSHQGGSYKNGQTSDRYGTHQ